MNEPYFEVGEEVILESKSAPEWNGEHVIEHVLPNGTWVNPSECTHVHITEGFGYKLMGVESSEKRVTGYFVQSALRKKHKPSGKSFQELITNLQPTEATL